MDSHQMGGDAAHNKDAKQAQKRKLKKLVFAALVTNSAVGVGLLAVSAQAHGNASSHSALQLDWDFDNFVMKRESIVNPDAPSTALLQDLQKRRLDIRNAERLVGPNLAQLNVTIGARVLNLDDARRLRFESSSTELRLAELSHQLALRPTSKAVVDGAAMGKLQEALDAIPVGRSVATALDEYSLVQLDLINYGAANGLSTPALLPETIAVSQAALAYLRTNKPEDQERASGFLHNLASACAPDAGAVTPEQQQIGLNAAREALAMRVALGKPAELGVAEYMVGIYQYRAKDYASAEKSFADARARLATAAPNSDSYQWATLFLGYAQLAQGRTAGQGLVDQAKAGFFRIGSAFGERYAAAGTGR